MWWWLVSNWLPLRGTLKFQVFPIHSTNWHFFFVDRIKLCCDKFVLCGRRETSSGVRQPIRAQYETNWPIRSQYETNWSIRAQYETDWPIRAQYLPLQLDCNKIQRIPGPVIPREFPWCPATNILWIKENINKILASFIEDWIIVQCWMIIL